MNLVMSDFIYDTMGTVSTSLDASCNLDSRTIPAMPISGTTSPLSITPHPATPVPLTHGVSLISMTTPLRNSTGASSSLGDISLQPDEARRQMNCDLQDRICLLTKSDNFWGKILMTEAVPASVVTNISKEIKSHMKALENSSEEEEMYAPLVSPRLVPSRNLLIICRRAY